MDKILFMGILASSGGCIEDSHDGQRVKLTVNKRYSLKGSYLQRFVLYKVIFYKKFYIK